jgi:arylsulfatase
MKVYFLPAKAQKLIPINFLEARMSELDRRTFVKTVAGALAAPMISTLPSSGEATSPAGPQSRTRPPNVIIMICDDLGSADLGCYGSRIMTPNLDRMAEEGMRFTRFNTAHAICSASRAALLTGRYANRSHVEGAYFPGDKDGMDLDEKTLADILKPRGYTSMCIGKWHLGHTPDYLPTQRGFNAFFGVPWSDDMNPLPLFRDRTVVEENTDRDLLTPRYTEAAVKFIDASAAEPFFLYVAYSYPHDPARSSPRFRGRSRFGHFGDAVEEIDWSAGEILSAVKRNGLDSDTIVMFTSDHGPWFQGSPGALRGRKGTTFEGGTRVPFLIRWSGAIPAGKITSEWGANLDVVPTLTSLCGATPAGKPLDGVDLSPFLTGRNEGIDRGTVLYFAVSGKQEHLECARKHSWKLRIAQRDGEIYINDWTAGKRHFCLATPELYNLEADPGESYDVALDNPEMVREIKEDIEALIPGFPENVVRAYAELKANPDSKFTPPGAAPRPANLVPPAWMWTRKD